MTKWRKIPGFSRYLASSAGEIASLNYKNTRRAKILKPAQTEGYLKTMLLNDDNRYKTISVHRIICLAFLGPSHLEVNHIDGNPSNNHITNLEYVTHSENLLHAYRIGLQKPMNGESNGSAKLTEAQVIEIREYVRQIKSTGKKHWNRKEVAKKYGVSDSYIKELVMNRTTRKNVWSHI